MFEPHAHASGHDEGPASGHESGGAAAHGASIQTFCAVFVGLLFLTVCSYLSFRLFHGVPLISWTLMMAISCMKALLVISFFMHLIWEANWKYVLTIPASLMSILLLLLLIPDIGFRTTKYSEERWRNAAQPQIESKAEHRVKRQETGHARPGAGHAGADH